MIPYQTMFPNRYHIRKQPQAKVQLEAPPRAPHVKVRPDDYVPTVALCVGGSENSLVEYEAAKAMVEAAGGVVCNFVCNDMIETFPYIIDHACTVHPEKMLMWIHERNRLGNPPVGRMWCHKRWPGFSDYTRDWMGSSGLMTAIAARTSGFTHVILCGIPMDSNKGHFKRKKDWHAAHGFHRGWEQGPALNFPPFVRSMSGWTQKKYGAPNDSWLKKVIPDPLRPPVYEPLGLKA